MRRGVIALVSIALLAPALPAAADEIYPMVFPVAGEHRYTDTWGAARSGGRSHQGTDIMADKMVPIVAVADGTVGWMHDEWGGRCCAMEIRHDDGYRSWYIHMNNDTPGTDDGLGWGFAEGIVRGARVRAGQLIGWVGDSGNAEWTGSHLHFELHDQNNVPFNPYQSLLAATPPDRSVVTWHSALVEEGSLVGSASTIETHVHDDSGVVVAGDFDGDGADEIAVGGDSVDGWTVSEFSGQESLWSTSDSSGALATVVGDFDGDGDDDIAGLSPTLHWTGFRSTRSGFDVESWGRFGGYGWRDFLIADFDGDGRDEFLAFHPGTKTWWLSDLRGSTFEHRVFASYGTSGGWQKHLAADIDGNGSAELLSFHPVNGTWWASELGQRPRLVIDVRTNSGWQHLTTVDADNDGSEEIAMFHPSNGSWWVVDDNPEDLPLYRWGLFATKSGWVNPVAIDINGDSLEDMVIRHEPSGRVWGLIAGQTNRLVFIGEFVAGPLEAEWTIDAGSGLGLVAYTRD